MRYSIYIFPFLVMFFNPCLGQKPSDLIKLETSQAYLILREGNKLEIKSKNGDGFLIKSDIQDLGEITLAKISELNTKYKFDNSKIQFTLNSSSNRLSFYYVHYIDEISSNVTIEYIIELKNDAFYFSSKMKVDSDSWTINSLVFPRLLPIESRNNDIQTYWPKGLGELVNNQNYFSQKQVLRFPGPYATMPWYSLNTGNQGLYMGIHDKNMSSADISLSFNDDLNIYETSVTTPIYRNEYISPYFVIKPYTGKWFEAANTFRSWYNSIFVLNSPPNWVISDDGWLLAILKQQNGNVMWSYKDIDKLCDVASNFNLSTIGLFGWASGGHDRYYPNYVPDPLMGGRSELENAIKRAQERGFKIILYSNGKLIDTSTDFYKFHGIETIMLGENKKPMMDFYVKYNNESPVVFSWACAGSKLWRNTMIDLAKQAHSLGADGILYDQLGSIEPDLCFSTYHDHEYPMSDVSYRLKMVQEVQKQMKSIDNSFIVMTEANNCYIQLGIDYGHGGGYSLSKYSYPDMYRYTFPEFIETQRNPNPLLTRTDANYALIYGLRTEIESRYTADVDYLLNSMKPSDNSYSTVNYPPDINKMKNTSTEETMKYTSSLISLKRKYSNFFYQGKFISDDGFEVIGEDIVGKGFKNGDELAITVWNQNKYKSGNFEIKLNGYRLTDCEEIGQKCNNPFKNLGSNSIRVLKFKRQQ
ncbi:DUF6259 domain-containing protein [Flavobacteriaceae bacterium F89]|uniref:DUF6259 domain-containing protein n=1 Tax=Cerina litoralis TaxID=2874477 RepID=A0AAE3EVZ9_9FLAO|nr:DUF6259 domain-containing protein [Cerina litoralis]MCG2462080.1 DUF6259 domain-containing protein [Cerina litoralis]